MRGVGVVLIALTLALTPFISSVQNAHAAVSDWQQGININPKSDTDYGSASFRESLENFVEIGGDSVALVIPVYQSNLWSTDVNRGWNTPTDESLAQGISVAKSLGLRVVVKVHLEIYEGGWRAEIQPWNRDEWFQKYSDLITHFAQIANDNGADIFNVGSEMVNVAAHTVNADNTDRWRGMIDRVRGVFNGGIMYTANSTGDGGCHIDEKVCIQFWDAVDYIGLSVYYGLWGGDVQGMMEAWGHWDHSDIRPFVAQQTKPIIFSEIGYRSVEQSHQDPWNWARGGPYDGQQQVRAYEAFFRYWDSVNYVDGAYLWEWESNPHAGGEGSTSYTPQNKPAQNVLSDWYGRGGNGGGGDEDNGGGDNDAVFETYAVTGGVVEENSEVQITARVENVGSQVANTVVDIEVYNGSGDKVHQKYFEGQNFGAGEERAYDTYWVPSMPGIYQIKIGIFGSGWSPTLSWNNNALEFEVARANGGGGDEDPPPPDSGNIHVWWPTDGARISGTQPLKAVIYELNLDSYNMFWQVGNGQLNGMYDSAEDYPHKEAYVDFTNWNWNGSGPYTLTFVAENKGGGETVGRESVDIFVE